MSRRLGVAALALAAAAGGCQEGARWGCDTRAGLAGTAEPAQWVAEIAPGLYTGEVVVEAPENLWTGAYFTGRPCTIEVRAGEGAVHVRTSVATGEVVLRSRLGHGDSPFAWGETGAGEPVVVQHQQGVPVSATVTSYTADGVLSYGACGDAVAPFRECHRGAVER